MYYRTVYQKIPEDYFQKNMPIESANWERSWTRAAFTQIGEDSGSFHGDGKSFSSFRPDVQIESNF